MKKVGVFVCHCGSNIAGVVDVKRVAKAAESFPGVVFSTDYQYMCSDLGQLPAMSFSLGKGYTANMGTGYIPM